MIFDGLRDAWRMHGIFWKESLAMWVSIFCIPTMVAITSRYLKGTMTSEDHLLMMDYREDLKGEDKVWSNCVPLIWIISFLLAANDERIGFSWWMAIPFILVLAAFGLDQCLQLIAKEGDIKPRL